MTTNKGMQCKQGPAIVAMCTLVELLEFLNAVDNFGLVDVKDLSSHDVVIHDLVDLIEVENDIHLTDALEIHIKGLDEEMDGLQSQQLVIIGIHGNREVQTSITSGDQLVGAELNEVGHLGVSLGNELVNLILKAGLLLEFDGHVPLGKSGLSLFVLKQQIADHLRIDQDGLEWICRVILDYQANSDRPFRFLEFHIPSFFTFSFFLSDSTTDNLSS